MDNTKYTSMTNREIRSFARESLVGNMFLPICVSIVYILIYNTFFLCSQFSLFGNGIGPFLFSTALLLIMDTVWGLFRYGISYYFISLVTKKEPGFASFFSGFTHSPDRTLGVAFIISLIKTVITLPYTIYGTFFADVNSVSSVLIALCAMLACNLIYYLISLIFAPVYFILCDYPDLTLPMIFIMTISLMTGKKCIKFLLLQLSFLPFILLSFLSFGIGMIWVIPYQNTAYAFFYEDLCKEFSSQDSST